MKFELLHIFQSPSGTDQQSIMDELTIAEAAEDHQFHGIWVAELGMSDYGICSAPSLLLAAVARKTKRLRLGTACVNLPFRHPLQIAQEFALLDHLSGGRLEFGVGRGYQPHLFAGYGLDTADATDRFDEALEVIQRAWTGEQIGFNGVHFNFDDVTVRPQPIQRPRPPIWMMAMSPDSYWKAGYLGSNLLFAPGFGGPDSTPENTVLRYQAGLAKAGHDPASREIGALCMVHVGKTTQAARKEFAPFVQWYYKALARVIAPSSGVASGYESYQARRQAAEQMKWSTLVESGAVICGDAAYVTERIKELRHLFGFTHFLHWARLGGMPLDIYMPHMKRMRDHVIPSFHS